MKAMTSLKSLVARLLRLSRSWGVRYQCPCCGWSSRNLEWVGLDLPVLRTLDVVGSGIRRAGCPFCGSKDRDRLVLAFLRDHSCLSSRSAEARVLHIAPEQAITRWIQRLGVLEYVCGDKFETGHRYPSHVQHMDICNTKLPGDRFDLVICCHTLEHVPDESAALAEIRRVLRPGGQAVLQVPIAAKMEATLEHPEATDSLSRARLHGQHDHVRLHGKDYPERLRSKGFAVQALDLSRDQRYARWGLNPRELLFVATKS